MNHAPRDRQQPVSPSADGRRRTLLTGWATRAGDWFHHGHQDLMAGIVLAVDFLVRISAEEVDSARFTRTGESLLITSNDEHNRGNLTFLDFLDI
jgi:hypothetical protein